MDFPPHNSLKEYRFIAMKYPGVGGPLSNYSFFVFRMNPDEYIITPCNNHFVKSKLRKGLLPEILEHLLGARKK